MSPATASLLASRIPAIVGTTRVNGQVKLTPAWYEYRDGLFWLNSWRGARWLAQVERAGGATLFFADPTDMYRTVHVEARLLSSEVDADRTGIDRLSLRYRGEPYRTRLPQERVSLCLEPVVVRSTLDRPGRGAVRSSGQTLVAGQSTVDS